MGFWSPLQRRYRRYTSPLERFGFFGCGRFVFFPFSGRQAVMRSEWWTACARALPFLASRFVVCARCLHSSLPRVQCTVTHSAAKEMIIILLLCFGCCRRRCCCCSRHSIFRLSFSSAACEANSQTAFPYTQRIYSSRTHRASSRHEFSEQDERSKRAADKIPRPRAINTIVRSLCPLDATLFISFARYADTGTGREGK